MWITDNYVPHQTFWYIFFEVHIGMVTQILTIMSWKYIIYVRHKIGHKEENREIDNNFCLYNFFVIDDSIYCLIDT